jgi:hypothetical protein
MTADVRDFVLLERADLSRRGAEASVLPGRHFQNLHEIERRRHESGFIRPSHCAATLRMPRNFFSISKER